VVEAHGDSLAGDGVQNEPDQFLVIAWTFRKFLADRIDRDRR
jgi:hypothetical protein